MKPCFERVVVMKTKPHRQGPRLVRIIDTAGPCIWAGGRIRTTDFRQILRDVLCEPIALRRGELEHRRGEIGAGDQEAFAPGSFGPLPASIDQAINGERDFGVVLLTKELDLGWSAIGGLA